MKSLLKYLPIIVLVHLTSTCAVAQVRHGTVVVIYYTDQKIILAADSRQVSTDPSAAPRDHGCKIATPDGRVVFAAAGIADYTHNGGLLGPTKSWTATDEIHKAYETKSLFPTFSQANLIFPTNLGSSVDPILEIAKMFEMYETFDFIDLNESDPETVAQTAQKQHGELTDTLIGGLDANGQLVLYLTRLTYADTGIAPIFSRTDPAKRPILYRAIGEPDVVNEFVDVTSDRAKKEAQAWKPPKGSHPADYDILKAMRLVQLTINYGPGDVGGKIEAVELDRDGTLHWFANPNNCPVD